MDSTRNFVLLFCVLALAIGSVDAAPPAGPVAPLATPAPGDKASSPATSSVQRPLRIAFVDMDIVLKQSKAVQEQIGRVEDQLELKKKEIDRKVAEYNRLRDSLERQDSILTDDEKGKRRKRIQELKSEIEDLQYDANKHLRQSERGVVEPVLDAVMETVRQLGEREGYDLVLRGELVLYGNPAVDLTDKLIAELDSKELVLPTFTPEGPSEPRASDKESTTTLKPRPSRTPELLPLMP